MVFGLSSVLSSKLTFPLWKHKLEIWPQSPRYFATTAAVYCGGSDKSEGGGVSSGGNILTCDLTGNGGVWCRATTVCSNTTSRRFQRQRRNKTFTCGTRRSIQPEMLLHVNYLSIEVEFIVFITFVLCFAGNIRACWHRPFVEHFLVAKFRWRLPREK